MFLARLLVLLPLLVSLASCRHKPLSKSKSFWKCGAQSNTFVDEQGKKWQVNHKPLAGGTFGDVYQISSAEESRARRFFRFAIGEWPNKTYDKVLKMPNSPDPKDIRKFQADEDLMARLSAEPHKLPFAASKKIEFSGFQHGPGYVKPRYRYQLQDILSLPNGMSFELLGKEIALKFKKLTSAQSGMRKVEGLLIHDIGFIHGNNAMFDQDYQLTFVDMVDYFDYASHSPKADNLMHNKAFLDQWHFLQAYTYVQRDAKAGKASIMKGLLAEFSEGASPALLKMMGRLPDEDKIFAWKIRELGRLSGSGLGIRLRDFPETVKTSILRETESFPSYQTISSLLKNL